ncbi:MAG: universal stress protein [Pseudomonadota bacterium]
MKRILVMLGNGTAAPVLEAAMLVAGRFDSLIVGLHAVSTQQAAMMWGEMGVSLPPEVAPSLEREARERRQQARLLFENFMAARGVPLDRPPAGGKGVAAAWREEDGRPNNVVGSLGRIFDLIAVERPETLGSLAAATLEAALFESGRPVLMAPPKVGPTLGETVVIAWNCSTESARAVAFAMPFLAKAKTVHVVSVEGATTLGPSAEELARALSEQLIPATSRHVSPARSRTAGETFLDEAAASGADLLIKGAYTQSRLRQMIFGGATSHILKAAEIPVVLAH